jgi:hypothetical protein
VCVYIYINIPLFPKTTCQTRHTLERIKLPAAGSGTWRGSLLASTQIARAGRKICSLADSIFRQVGTSGRLRLECDEGVSQVTQSLVSVFGPGFAASSRPSDPLLCSCAVQKHIRGDPQHLIYGLASDHAKLPRSVEQIIEKSS